MADNFNIAKFLKENSLGSHGILGKYIDLHALKEQEEAGDEGLFSITLDTASDLNKIKKYAKSKGILVKVINPEGPGGGWPVVEYTGSKEALEDFIDTFFSEDAEYTKSQIMPAHGGDNMQEAEYDDGGDNQYDGNYDNQFGPATVNEDEMDSHNRMMGLIDTKLEPKLPEVARIIKAARDKGLSDRAIFNALSTNSMTKSSIDSLVDDGFDYQDIVDFLATDFSTEDEFEYDDAESFDLGDRPGPNDPMGPNEEVSVSSSDIEMEGLSEDIDIWQMAGDHLENFRNELASAHAMASQSGQREWVTALNKIALRLDALEGAMAEANAKLGVLPTK